MIPPLHRAHIEAALAPPAQSRHMMERLAEARLRSDADLAPELRDLLPPPEKLRHAAVLVPLIEREDGLRLLLTERSADLPSHAGQVAFPGGRVDDTDDGPIAAALREAHEEVGIEPDWVEIAGLLTPYLTSSGFKILPVVGFVEPVFTLNDLTLEPAEVARVFEVPFEFVMNPDNHQRHEVEFRGRSRHYYAMPYGEHYIWGATAGMLVNFYDTLMGERAPMRA